MPEARFLWSYGLDSGEYEGVRSDLYLKDCPLDRLEQCDVLLAYEVNGEPLDAEHGFPLRLLVPGFYGTNSVKWLSRLHLADRRADGPFTTQLYNDAVEGGTRPVWQIAPESVIVSPAPATQIGGQAVEIWDWAWADGGVSRRRDFNGRRAELAPGGTRPAGRLGVAEIPYLLAGGRRGEAVLMSRATASKAPCSRSPTGGTAFMPCG